MHTESFGFELESGWTVDEFPKLDSRNTLIFVFAAPEFFAFREPIRQLVEQYPLSHIVGCSTSGEIHGTTLKDRSVSVSVVRFDSTTVRTVATVIEDSDCSYAAAVRLANELDHPELRAVFVLSDGLNVNGSELVRGFNRSLSPSVVVTGGLAGDGPRFEHTFIIQRGQLAEKAICAVGLYGQKLRVGHASKGGWDKFGHERIITRSKGNVLFELDGRPALDIYKQYLGDKSRELPVSALLFPLSVREGSSSSKSLVRTVLAVDEEANSMTFAGDVPENSVAQFLYANLDRLIEGATDAALNIDCGSHSETLTIAISCIGRRLVLSDRTEEEIEAVSDALPPNAGLTGFYSYGEISPFNSGQCDLHNQSMTLTTFSEVA